MTIPFNKPYLTGKEVQYIREAVQSGKISGNGEFTKKCQVFFEKRSGFKKCLLTNSCTDALEMAAILINIREGDEVIMPSYTFVSTANAFVLRGARIVFADSRPDHPGMDEDRLEALITERTRAIVPVHYAGVACDMDKIMALAHKYGLYVIEDAAHAIDAYYKGRPLGSIGDLAAFSFHETKNIISGEGGMLVINDEAFEARSEIIWEKGTNRAAFWRGEVDKYGWVDIGSSYLPSEIIAAFLYAQLEHIAGIQEKRVKLWQVYDRGLRPFESRGLFRLPFIPDYATNNAHMYYLVCNSPGERDKLSAHLRQQGILSVFHYQSLHKSPFYINKYQGSELLNSDLYTDRLLRLPMYYDLSDEEAALIVKEIEDFFRLSH